MHTLSEQDLTLCQICGERLGNKKLFGLDLGGGMHSGTYKTTGTGMHARCALLAAHYCPYLRQLGDRAFRLYTGDDHGFAPVNSHLQDKNTSYYLAQVFINYDTEAISVAQIKQLAKEQAID